MMDEFDVVEKTEWYRQDLKALTSQIEEYESTLRLKRRWLMGLPLFSNEQKRVEELLPLSDKIMPETLLREDDVGYEDIRSCVERGSGAHNCETEGQSVEENLQEFKPCYDVKDVFLLLDNMTNTGLCSMSEILTGDMITFDKTNRRMKKTIKELLPKVFADRSYISQRKLHRLCELLKEPETFRGDKVLARLTASEAYRAAAVKVLEGLEDFPVTTLTAMHRKLTGLKGYVPKMQPTKSGRNRDSIISVVRKRCMQMLSVLDKTDEPGDQLAGALAVAGLSLELLLHRPALTEFKRFSTEVVQLQNDIAKAIHLLNDSNRVSMMDLKKVQLLVDPDLKLSSKSLRAAVRNLLTQYLFEVSDTNNLPDCLVETLEIINRRSHLPNCGKKSFGIYSSSREMMKTEIKNEVECVLAVSAQAKEVVLGLFPKHEFDKDFAQAYVEDFDSIDALSVSDDEDVHMRNMFHHDTFSSHCPSDQAESVGEIYPPESNSPVSMSERDDCSSVPSPSKSLVAPMKSIHISRMDSDMPYSIDHSLNHEESKVMDAQCVVRDRYSSECTKNLEYDYTDSFKVSRKHLKSEQAVSCSLVTPKFEGFNSKEKDRKLDREQIKSGNQYLAVQEACDRTSMVAYRSVGRLLEMLAKSEGLELYSGDRSYLRSYSSLAEDVEDDVSTPESLHRLWKDVRED